MASIEPQHIEAARNLGAPRWRVLFDIVLPQVRGTLLVGLVLSFVTMLSVLSVPLMINPNSPTMITVDVAYRINTHADYAVANALCLHVAAARGGRRRGSTCGTRSRRAESGVSGDCGMRVRTRCGSRIARARRCVLALLAFAIFGPLLNLVLWAFAEKLVFPEQAAVGIRLHVLGARVRPRGNALASLGTSVWIARADRRR